ncbi:cation transporter [Roseivivax marinus]|uniref:cation transporter n=1 Tax=Roseivivax marinus TaxID=1379903 RepID=UPI00273E676F|nr:cation transporter [Roseivivax marinus]
MQRTLVFIFILLAAPVAAAERSIELSVPGMSCASCPFIVQSAIGRLAGVFEVTTDSEARTARVTYDDAVVDLAAIREASAKAGYETTPVSEGE